MFSNLILFIIIILSLKCSLPTRRIVGGKRVNVDKRYMVYLLKSDKSNRQLYDSWLCGGAIVSQTHILTSAACLADVTYLYAIAGYKKYVRSENLELDECTRKRKQKVVKTCVPKKYKINYQNVYEWAYMDIGFAIVEKPYNFSDLTYRRHCSYVPAPIKINFHSQYQQADTDVFVYGWGHAFSLRLPGDYDDYNQEYLQGTTTRIVDRSYCAKYFHNLSRTLDHYLICCTGRGYLDQEGNMDRPDTTNYNGCVRRVNNKCEDILNYEYDFDSRRNENDTTSQNETDSNNKTVRRQGVICQNDHGGPLVTWVGSEEYVIGVAVTSLYTAKFECVAPHIYSSTLCSSLFIKCVLNMPSHGSSRKMCESLGKESEYEIHETEIDWNKIDGNMDNDKVTVKNGSDIADNNIFKWNPNDTDNKSNVDKIKIGKGNTRTKEYNKIEDGGDQPFTQTDQLNVDTAVDDVVII